MNPEEELVSLNCVHSGCECKRIFLRQHGAALPEYVCIKHRRLYDRPEGLKHSHRSLPVFEDVVIKSGLLLKKGARSNSFAKRCVVLLPDRLVVYQNMGDSVPLVMVSCISL